MSDCIKVGVKLRPLIGREKADGYGINWRAISENTVSQVDPHTGALIGEPQVFDHVFSQESSNGEVFEELVKPIVEASVKGFNGTIFAYGQTASGKTYTMMGDKYETGVIPQAVKFIFDTIENTPGREFLLRVCFMEIYNEKVNDLLKKSNQNLKVSEENGNIIVKELEETITNSSQMVMDLMKKGERIRKIGETNMNDRSSRSHTIFRVIIESRSVGSDTDEAIQVSHLNLVDLAGSERAGATGSVGEQFKEGCSINKSLFTLGKVISELSDGVSSHVSFRDSKLTRILQSSLGGNALTSIICAVTPAAVEETSSTLGFATRARNIKNKAKVNEVLSEAALLKRYIRQMARLKSELSSLEEQKNAENQQLQNQNLILQQRINRLKDALLVPNDENSEQADKLHEKHKKLRRRTWSAPNRSISRMSLAPPARKPELFSDDGNSSSSKVDELNDVTDFFSTPLEEFEKNLIKAERAKSLGDEDWLPPSNGFQAVDDLDNLPPISYVQTRRPNKTHLTKIEETEFIAETPPPKLREKILCVERELDEISEFTRLEKQLYNEEIMAELDRVKNELRESQVKCESLLGLKEELENLRLTNPTSYDCQLLLLDSSKKVAQLTDENKDLRHQLSNALSTCHEIKNLREEVDSTRSENETLKGLVADHKKLSHQLQNEKEDFEIKLELAVSKHEARERDLIHVLEETRHELSLLQHPSQTRKHARVLYSLEEEPTIDDLAARVECLKEENDSLQHQLRELRSHKNEEVETLGLEIMKKNQLLESLQIALHDQSFTYEKDNLLTDELSKLKALVEEKTCELEEYKGISANKIEELYGDVVDLRKRNEELYTLLNADTSLAQSIDGEDSPSKLPTPSKHLDHSESRSRLVGELALKQEKIHELEKQLSDLLATKTNAEAPLENGINTSEVEDKGGNPNAKKIEALEQEFCVKSKNLENELESLRNSNNNLLKELQRKEDCITEANNEVEFLKKKLVESSDALESFKNQDIRYSSIDEQVTVVCQKCMESEKDIISVKEMLSANEEIVQDVSNLSVSSVLSQLISCLRNSEEKCCALEEERKILMTSKDLTEHKNALESLENTNRILMEELENLKVIKTNCNSELETLKEQLDEYKNGSRNVESSLSKMELKEDAVKEYQKEPESLKVVKQEEKTVMIPELLTQLETVKDESEEHRSESRCETCVKYAEEISSLWETLRAEPSLEVIETKSLVSIVSHLVLSLRNVQEKCTELVEENETANGIRECELTKKYQSEIESLNDTNNTLMKELKSKENVLAKAATELEQLREQAHEFSKSSITDDEKVLEKSGCEKDDFPCEECIMLKEELDQSRYLLISEFNVMNVDLTVPLSSLISRFTHSVKTLNELNEVEAQLPSSQYKLEAEEENLMECLTEKQCKHVTELESLRNSNNNLMKELQRKEDCITEANNEVEFLKKKLVESSDALESFKNQDIQNSSIDEQVTVVCQKCMESEKDIISVKEMLSANEEIIQDVSNLSVSSVLSQLISRLRNSEEKCCALEEERKILMTSKDLTEHKNALESLENTNRILMEELENLKVIKTNCNSELETLKEQLDEYKNGSRNVESSLSKMELKEDAVKEYQKEPESLKVVKQEEKTVMIPELLTQLETVKDESEEHRSESRCETCVKYAEEISSLWETLRAEPSLEVIETKSLVSIVSHLVLSLRNAQEKCTELLAEKESAKAIGKYDLESHKTDFSEVVKQYQSEVESLKNTNVVLVEELETKKDIISDAYKEMDGLKLKLEDLKNAPTHDEFQAAKELLETKLNVLQNLQTELNQKEEMIVKLEGDKCHLQELMQTQLQHEFCDSKSSVLELQNRCSEYEKSVDELQQKLHEISNESLNIQTENNQLQSDVAHKESLLLQSESRTASLCNEVTEMKKLIEKLENEVSTNALDLQLKEKEVESLEDSFQNAQKDQKILVTELHDLQAKLSKKEEIIMKLECDISHIQETMQTQLQHDSESRVLELQNRCSEYEKSVEELQHELDETNNQSLNIQTENNQLKSEVAHKESLLMQSESRTASLCNEVTEMKKLIEKLENEVSTNALDLQLKEKEVESLEDSFQNAQKDQKILVTELHDLQAKLSDKEKIIMKLECEISHIQETMQTQLQHLDELRDSKSNVLELQNRCSKYEKCVEELQQKLHETSNESLNIQTENNQLQSEVAHKESLLMQSESRIASLCNEVTEMKKLIEKLENEVSTNALDLKLKEKEVESLEDSFQNAQKDQKILVTELHDLQAKLSKKEEIIVKLEGEISHIQEKMQTQLQHLDELSDSKSTLLELQNRCSEYEKSVEELQQKLHETSNESLNIQTENNQLKSEVARKEALFRQSQSKNTALYNEVTEMKELNKKLENEVSSSTSALKIKEKELESLEESLLNAKKDLKTLETELSRMKTEKDIVEMNLASKTNLPPCDEVKELEAEVTFYKQQHEEAIKASRELRLKHRKLVNELNKLKENDPKHLTGSQEVIPTVKEKEEIINTLEAKLLEYQSMLEDKKREILELNNAKSDLDNECEELLLWGKNLEKDQRELADKTAGVMKDLVSTKEKLFYITADKILSLANIKKQFANSLSKVTAEQVEMQFSSKEKATRNAKARVENLDNQIKSALEREIVDFNVLESICCELSQEIEIIFNLDEECKSVWEKIFEERKHTSDSATVECRHCSELLKVINEHETKAAESSKHMIHLESKLKHLGGETKPYEEKILRSSNAKKTQGLADFTSENSTLKAGILPIKPSIGEAHSKGTCCQCNELLKKHQSDKALLNAKIGQLNMMLKVKNKPAEDKILRYEDKLKQAKEEIVSLKAERRRILQNTQDNTFSYTPHKGENKRSVETQTLQSSDEIYRSLYWSGGPSGIVEESNRAFFENKCRKLEGEVNSYKKLSVKRKEKIDFLEEQLKKFMKDNQENDAPTYFTRSKK